MNLENAFDTTIANFNNEWIVTYQYSKIYQTKKSTKNIRDAKNIECFYIEVTGNVSLPSFIYDIFANNNFTIFSYEFYDIFDSTIIENLTHMTNLTSITIETKRVGLIPIIREICKIDSLHNFNLHLHDKNFLSDMMQMKILDEADAEIVDADLVDDADNNLVNGAANDLVVDTDNDLVNGANAELVNGANDLVNVANDLVNVDNAELVNGTNDLVNVDDAELVNVDDDLAAAYSAYYEACNTCNIYAGCNYNIIEDKCILNKYGIVIEDNKDECNNVYDYSDNIELKNNLTKDLYANQEEDLNSMEFINLIQNMKISNLYITCCICDNFDFIDKIIMYSNISSLKLSLNDFYDKNSFEPIYRNLIIKLSESKLKYIDIITCNISHPIISPEEFKHLFQENYTVISININMVHDFTGKYDITFSNACDEIEKRNKKLFKKRRFHHVKPIVSQ